MRILLCNWAQFDDPRLAGGGVTVHLRGVIEELLRRDGVEVWFLSMGRRYGLFDRRARIVPTANVHGARVRSFALVNSPVKAPAHDAFHSISTWLKDPVSVRVVQEFVDRNGPFDAVHIHNLEGVGAGILRLARGAALRRMFYTLHNYMPVCPQIDLLYDGKDRCTDYREGHRCVACLSHDNRMEDLIAWARAAGVVDITRLEGHPLGGFLFDLLGAAIHLWRAGRNIVVDLCHGFRSGFRHWTRRQRRGFGRRHGARRMPDTPPLRLRAPLEPRALPQDFVAWRMRNGQALAALDGVFAVSELAAETARRFLPADARIEVLPLPSDLVTTREERAALRRRRQGGDGVTLSFLGYDLPSKGLPFMVEALADLADPFLKSRVDLLVVATLGPVMERRVRQLTRVFRSVQIVPGYRRDQLEEIASRIDLNVVPSIWWETFNQVTVELMQLGVPSLVSSTVGARQVVPLQEHFLFESGDAADFRRRLMPLLQDGALRERFFDDLPSVPNMRDHVDLLINHYRGGQ